jgi:hypothetical protein
LDTRNALKDVVAQKKDHMKKVAVFKPKREALVLDI